MASTYTPIATTTFSAASSLTFSSIPSTYTDLVLVWAGAGSVSSTLQIQLNSDTTNKYSYTSIYGNGSGAFSGAGNQGVLAGKGYLGFPGTSQSILKTSFNNYSNTTTYKTLLTRSDSNDYAAATVNLWASTSAINTIYLYPSSGTITGTATLYGIKAA